MHGFFHRFFFKEYVDIACISKTLIMQNFNLQDFLISLAAILGKSHKILPAEIIQKDDVLPKISQVNLGKISSEFAWKKTRWSHRI